MSMFLLPLARPGPTRKLISAGLRANNNSEGGLLADPLLLGANASGVLDALGICERILTTQLENSPFHSSAQVCLRFDAYGRMSLLIRLEGIFTPRQDSSHIPLGVQSTRYMAAMIGVMAFGSD